MVTTSTASPDRLVNVFQNCRHPHGRDRPAGRSWSRSTAQSLAPASRFATALYQYGTDAALAGMGAAGASAWRVRSSNPSPAEATQQVLEGRHRSNINRARGT